MPLLLKVPPSLSVFEFFSDGSLTFKPIFSFNEVLTDFSPPPPSIGLVRSIRLGAFEDPSVSSLMARDFFILNKVKNILSEELPLVIKI